MKAFKALTCLMFALALVGCANSDDSSDAPEDKPVVTEMNIQQDGGDE